jgi:hypothetical protein
MYIFVIFCGFSKQLYIYSAVSLGTPKDVLWNPKVPRNPVGEKVAESSPQTCVAWVAPLVAMLKPAKLSVSFDQSSPTTTTK